VWAHSVTMSRKKKSAKKKRQERVPGLLRTAFVPTLTDFSNYPILQIVLMEELADGTARLSSRKGVDIQPHLDEIDMQFLQISKNETVTALVERWPFYHELAENGKLYRRRGKVFHRIPPLQPCELRLEMRPTRRGATIAAFLDGEALRPSAVRCLFTTGLLGKDMTLQLFHKPIPQVLSDILTDWTDGELTPELVPMLLSIPEVRTWFPESSPAGALRIGYIARRLAGDYVFLERCLLKKAETGWEPYLLDAINPADHEYFFDDLDEAVDDLEAQPSFTVILRGHLDLLADLARKGKLFRKHRGAFIPVATHPETAPATSITRAGSKFKLTLHMGEREITAGEIHAIQGRWILLRDLSVWPFPESVPRQLLQRIDEWRRGEADARRLSKLIADPALSDYLSVVPSTEDNTGERPIPILRLSQHSLWPPQSRLRAAIFFRYGKSEINADSKAERCGKHPRSLIAEAEIRGQLDARRCVLPDSFAKGYMANTKTLIPVLADLRDAGWTIQSMGQPVHTVRRIHCDVRSGVDWFDLEAKLDFGTVYLDLLKAIDRFKAGERLIQLKDGTFALLPLDLVERFSTVAEFAELVDGQLRFPRNHAALLDALLAAQKVEFDADEAYTKATAALRGEILPASPAAEFAGSLRPYQSAGLGWLRHMRAIGFGGCLADDMGLGKTVQVIAHLQSLAAKRPHLVVAPRSVLENWAREAERFWPACDVHVHHGPSRTAEALKAPHDLIITTYGTLRSDATTFAKLALDTCVLDEAQVVKNPDTVAAKAVRLLRAEHRLALSGTPIENHLGDLWSIFEFLNPGMLGASTRFRALIETPRSTPNSATLQTISAAMRPYILRRTKTQVLDDLPDKTETTLYCELEGQQLREYQLRRDHVRADLLGLIESKGMASSKLKVIEALLRLRQCACHPGLVDDSLGDAPSAKLNVLLEQLQEIIDEGHKALVFSQFTSFLAFAKSALESAGITYEYLDGSTTNRQARSDRFNTDPDCPVFLISLKAGGLGLNLTAASYVYILDPWWNPAAEAQAIDRAHRIGQTRKVFAYRLIARDTVEEKILLLQERKRDLADAILSADKSLLKKLDVDDLQLLLS
jgi:superfamily II DNA or RNA helicase